MIIRDRLGDILQHHRLADPRRRDDQRTLALTLRADEVDDPGRHILLRGIELIEGQLFVRVQRGQVVEIDAVADRLGIVEIDADELG